MRYFGNVHTHHHLTHLHYTYRYPTNHYNHVIYFCIPLNQSLDLKESLEVVDLEQRVDSNDNELQNVPPLDSGVCGLGSVSVGSLSNNNVALLVSHLLHVLVELGNLLIQSVVGQLVEINHNDTMHVESHILGTDSGELVGEAVLVSAGHLDGHLDVSVRDLMLLDNLVSVGVVDLC